MSHGGFLSLLRMSEGSNREKSSLGVRSKGWEGEQGRWKGASWRYGGLMTSELYRNGPVLCRKGVGLMLWQWVPECQPPALRPEQNLPGGLHGGAGQSYITWHLLFLWVHTFWGLTRHPSLFAPLTIQQKFTEISSAYSTSTALKEGRPRKHPGLWPASVRSRMPAVASSQLLKLLPLYLILQECFDGL